MVERLVKICDFCDNKASGNCILCGKDCCSRHYKDKSIIVGQEIVCSVLLCGNCSGITFGKEFKEDLMKQVVEHLKKRGILNAIDDSGDKEESPDKYPYNINRPFKSGYYPIKKPKYIYGVGE